MWIIVGTQWISGLAVQSPLAVGPVYSEEAAEKVAAEMEKAGRVNVEIIDAVTVTTWKKDTKEKAA